MFYRIFGKNGFGKTEYIYNELSRCVGEKKRAFLIVPEQSAVMTEKQIIKRLGGKSNLYVEVINFKRLCNRVFRELGGLTSVHIDEGAKKLLMLNALSEISPFLREYAECAKSADFAKKALDFVAEANSCKVSPGMLEKTAEKLIQKGNKSAVSSKLYDLALIIEAYNRNLSCVDGVCADIYQKLCEKLKDESFFGGCDVFFDSFYGFTAQEYEIMSLIAEQADNTYVSFACEYGCRDEIFERSIKSAQRCLEIAQRSGCEIKDVSLTHNFRHGDGSDLYRFSRFFATEALTAGEYEAQSDKSLRVVLCRNIYDEVKFAAGCVHKLIRDGEKLSDIVICAKNTADYVGIIDAVFEKAGIPIGIDIPETLAESALFELVCSAMEASSTFSAGSVIRYIKSGLSGLCESEADLLETYIRTWNISPSLMKSGEDFTMNPDGYVDSEPDGQVLGIVNCARGKVLSCLLSLSHNIKAAENIKDMCMCIYNLLQDIKRVSEKECFDDGNGGTSLALLYECLDSFAAAAPEEKITPSRFLELFRGCAADYNTGHIPSLNDSVSFSSVDLVRCENTGHVILLGVNNGVFPSSCSGSSLVSDHEKKLLLQEGIELYEGADELVYDELFLAYNAVTSAKKSCHITYLAEDLSGGEMYPSVIATAALKISAGELLVYNPADISEEFAGDELLFEEFSSMDNGVIKNTLAEYFSKKEAYAERTQLLSESLAQGDFLDSTTAELLYGKDVVTSYSRLEKMAGCPFSHFCAYTLKLKPEPTAELGPSEAGSVMHKILEELVPLLCKKNENGTYPDENEAKALVTELLSRHLSRISRTDINKLPKRFVYLYNRLAKILFEMAVNIVRERSVTKFEPRDFELTVRNDADVKPLPIDLGDGCKLYIVGQIDRVDVYEKDGVSYIKIVDYKTGKKTFKLKEIKCGFNLQMLLYLASLTTGKNERYGENTVPAGVLYSNVLSSMLSLSLGEDDIERRAGETTKPVSSGIFLDDDEILMALDPTENSTFLPIGRKNGEATKKDALASLEEMGELLNFALSTASELAVQMKAGNKAIAPFDGRAEGVDIDVCRYCDMKTVCMREQA